MKKYFLYMMTAAFVFAAVFTSCEKDNVEEIPTYTVRFDSKGGTPTPQDQTVKEGNKVTKPADPTRDNYSFTGWAIADNETAALWNFETETVTVNMTLFARWAINTYAVTFDSDGGSAVTAQNVTHGSTASKPTDPTRNGYEFDGWFIGETEWNFSNAITAPITLKAKWTALFIVTFDSDGGSEVSAQTIRSGNTATKPADPTKEFKLSSGLYLGAVNIDALNCTFIEWRKEGENTAFDFNMPVTVPITLKAVWNTPSFSLTQIASVLPNDIAASFTYVNANSYSGEVYTLLIGANVTLAEQTLSAANAKLAIIGIGAERIILQNTSTTIPSLFTINGNNATNLTLGKNITINGGDVFLYPQHMVHVKRGSLTMLDGSKLSGFSAYVNGNSSTIFVEGLNSIFKMEGGEICENLPNGGRSYRETAGVSVSSSGTFEMSGGSITGNNNSISEDVIIGKDCTFRLSGNARIGTVMLDSDNSNNHASVTTAANYNGTVTTLNLYAGSFVTSPSTDLSTWWTNKSVIINGTANVINMFNNGLGSFVSNYYTQPISATHILNASGYLVLKDN